MLDGDVSENRIEFLGTYPNNRTTRYFLADQGAEMSHSADQKVILRYVFSDYLLDPNKFRFRKVIRVFAIALTFIWKISKVVSRVRENKMFRHIPPNNLAQILKYKDDKYIVTTVHQVKLLSCLTKCLWPR